MILFYFYHQIVKYTKQPCITKKKKERKTENRRGFFFFFFFFFFFLQDFLNGSTRGSLNVRWRNFFLQISPDIKYTETNIGQQVECTYDV